MPDLEFDPSKSFDEHVAALKAHIAPLDPECAEILFDKLDLLLGDGDPAKARIRRGEFNAAILRALEALIAEDDKRL